MKDYFWIVVLAIVGLTVFIAYILNKNIDPDEEHDWGNDDDEYKNNNKDEEDN